MKYFEKLNEYVFFNSLESKILQVLSDGKNAAWLYATENNEYIGCDGFSLSMDILEDYPFIRGQMVTKSLFVYWSKNKFRAKLVYRERVGGYKEPFHEVCFASASGCSVQEALKTLNEKLRDFNPTDCLVDLSEYTILQFPSNKSDKLELVKK